MIARLTGAMLAVAWAAGASADERLIAAPPGMTVIHSETRAPDRYRVPVRPVADVPEAPDGPPPEATTGGWDAMLAQLVRQGRVVLDGIDFDSAAVSKAAQGLPVLDTAAALLKARPDLAVAIIGHSDNVGGLEANIRLSRARAAAVVDALVSRGVPRDRLRAEGARWLAPLRSNATPEGRAANRRVEMVLRN